MHSVGVFFCPKKILVGWGSKKVSKCHTTRFGYAPTPQPEQYLNFPPTPPLGTAPMGGCHMPRSGTVWARVGISGLGWWVGTGSGFVGV